MIRFMSIIFYIYLIYSEDMSLSFFYPQPPARGIKSLQDKAAAAVETADNRQTEKPPLWCYP